MSNSDALESDRHRAAARVRWRKEGDPVLTRSVDTVVKRSADLDDTQRAAIEAALTREARDD